MEELTDAIDRAAPEHFTQPLPKSAQAQMRALVKAAKGDKKAVAAALGVDPNTVRRYLKGERKHPRAALREALIRELQKVWQPGIRRQARKKAATTGGITVEVWAYFGYTAPVGTTDEPRLRHLTVHLPPEYADRLFTAQDQGASDQQMRDIMAEGFQEVYFKDGGRAQGLEVEFTGIQAIDVQY
ncbi:XRE family transcriptional regulator [Streptomyces sp. SP17BM10]|uniref:telomere-protecting terminal protein Tpg n=1 Tax=Streptomyces sp. SP17BM10 TaxID=3002530 RepID=UPI002E75C230|nr:XRE family transcriptional regulator [Streptomyces sp. SP17BM10]MEE1782674.1 XRE family transcriptional regulator [Streptomyces sp. SP17BM10]